MRDTVKAFIEHASRSVDPPGPVVEVGACQTAGQEGYADLRPFFPGREYIGCDAAPGPGVDRVEDVHALTFADASIGTIVCADTLEHVADPPRAVAEMRRVLRPGGVLLLSTPFAFPIHYMPDYVRYTPEGLARLLAGFERRAVWSHGDAQNPHTVNAVASAAGLTAEAFAASMSRFEAGWAAARPFDGALRFRPLRSVLRCGGWPSRPTGAGRTVEQTFDCPHDALVRIDVVLGSDGLPRSTGWRLHAAGGGAEATVTAWVPLPGELCWVAFPLPPGVGRAGAPLRLRLEPLDPAGVATAFLCEHVPSPAAELRIDGVPAAGGLCLEAFCARE